MATGTDVEPMDEEHRNILRRCKGTLVKDMEPEEVLLQMADPLLFTTEDENRIKSRDSTRQQKCEALLDMLPRKGARAYEIFKKTIEIVHPHLARTIVEAENKELRSELRIERQNSADLRRRLAYSKVKRGTPTDEELEMLGRDIADIWIKLGRRLDVSDAKLTEIDKARELLSEKAYHTLKHWKQNKGAAANYQALCNALQHELVQRQDLVEKFCYIKGIDTGTRPLAKARFERSGQVQVEHLERSHSQTVDAVKGTHDFEEDAITKRSSVRELKNVQDPPKESEQQAGESETNEEEFKKRLDEVKQKEDVITKLKSDLKNEKELTNKLQQQVQESQILEEERKILQKTSKQNEAEIKRLTSELKSEREHTQEIEQKLQQRLEESQILEEESIKLHDQNKEQEETISELISELFNEKELTQKLQQQVEEMQTVEEERKSIHETNKQKEAEIRRLTSELESERARTLKIKRKLEQRLHDEISRDREQQGLQDEVKQ